MKNSGIQTKVLLFVFAVLMGPVMDIPLFANDSGKKSEQIGNPNVQYNEYQGTVKNQDNGEPLMFATIALMESNIATVTNSNGEFLLKVPKTDKATTLQVSHVGYKTREMPLSSFANKKTVIKLTMATIPLDQVNIYPDDAELLMRNVMRRIRHNYDENASMMKGFYREAIKRNRSHVGISEAVVDIAKAGYLENRGDQVKIFKGRKSEDLSRMDTLVFRLQGGPAVAILMDIIKHPQSLLSEEDFDYYNYKIESVTSIDGRPHFVVAFNQKPGGDFPMYNGRYYVETNTLALTTAEFSLNLEDAAAATKMLIRKKPAGLKIATKEVKYLVKFREQNGKWYFNYARGEMAFRFNWKRKLFNTNYAAMIEIAVTDRDDTRAERFRNSERFKSTQILSKKVSSFSDANFWGEHNTIEPDESIQSAIKKLKRKGHL